MRRHKKHEHLRGISSNATTGVSNGASPPAHWIVLEGKTLPYTIGPVDRKILSQPRNPDEVQSESDADTFEKRKLETKRYPILGTRNRMKLAQNALVSNVDILRDAPSRPRGLCDKCFELDLFRFKKDGVMITHHETFRSLAMSAKTCLLCYLFLRDAPKPSNQVPFTYDGTRSLLLSASRQRSAHLSGLQLDKLIVHFPVIKPDGPSGINIQIKQPLIAGRDSQAALSGDVIGRRAHGGQNILCVVNWLADCVKTHKNCQRGLNRPRFADLGDINAVPPRLVDVGTSDHAMLRIVETDHTFSKPYLALSYTKGTAQVLSTNKVNLRARRIKFPLEKMNRTFKQAIILTRQLGFRYIWIDALCIVMDSSSDRGKHVPRMGIIFQNATLTLSASCSSSADDGLIATTPSARREARLPYRNEDGTALGHYFVGGAKPKSFDQDVSTGSLSTRGWCTQARVLSRRILHFGRDQLFWECDSGTWSEESIMPLTITPRSDPLSSWRKDFLVFKRKMSMQSFSTSKESLGIYQLWYRIVEQYSHRALPREADKSSAIAGLAYIFACLMPKRDTYIAGLWQRDLAFGLLWSSGSFHKWRIKYVSLPTLPRAPSWSWISVDGPIAWPDGYITQYHARVLDMGSFFDQASNHELATLRIRGKLAVLSTLYGFRPQDAQWKRAARQAALQASTTAVGTGSGTAATADTDIDGGPIRLPCALFDTAQVTKTWNLLHNPLYEEGHDESSFRLRQKLKARTNKDFIALLLASAGCQAAGCTQHEGGNCGCGLGYALLLWPAEMSEEKGGKRQSGKGHGLMFRRVGIAQVRVADFGTDVAREREVVVV